MLKIKKKTEKVFEQIILHNSERYLSAEIVEKCFSYSNFINVDKQITGNGFTTAYLKLAPKKDKVNIIIVPNRQVILSKQKAYNHNENKDVKIGFIYGESDGVYSSDNIDFDKFNVLMFVADSFLNKLELLISKQDKIDKILIDEAHSCIIQSSFRNKLKGLIMNHLSVLLGIIAGLIIGGSIFGIDLMYQALNILMGFSIWICLIYCIYCQVKKGV